MTVKITAVTAVPEATPAWWIHWLNIAISVVALVGVTVHPGWHPPAELVEIVTPLALVLAVVSGLVFAVFHHQTGTSNVQAAYTYVAAHATELTTAAVALAPLVDRYPAVESRLTALETAPAAGALPANLKQLLDALNGDPPPVPASGTTTDTRTV